MSEFDLLATLTEFTAASIAMAYKKFAPPGAVIGEVLFLPPPPLHILLFSCSFDGGADQRRWCVESLPHVADPGAAGRPARL